MVNKIIKSVLAILLAAQLFSNSYINTAHANPGGDVFIQSYCQGLKRMMDDPWAEFQLRKQNSLAECQLRSAAGVNCDDQIARIYNSQLMDQMVKGFEDEWVKSNCKGRI